MGFASYLEDNIERLSDRIQVGRFALEESSPTAELRLEALKALADAEILLKTVIRELDLATSPEMDLAHEVSQLRNENQALRIEIEGERSLRERAEADNSETTRKMHRLRAETTQKVSRLQTEKRKLEKDFEKLPFGTAVNAYLPPRLSEKRRRD